jgi:hypothetical protein
MGMAVSTSGRAVRLWWVAIGVICALAAAIVWPGVRSVVAGRFAVAAGAQSPGVPFPARGAVSAAVGAGDPAYSVSGLRAVSPAQHLASRYSALGVQISSGPLSVNFGLTGVGRGGELLSPRDVPPLAAGNTVTYRYAGVVERWLNGPLGLEQTFLIGTRPAGSGPLQLVVGRLSAGMHARLIGGALVLAGAAGRGLRYGGLAVTDARGRSIAAWLSLRGRQVAINIADRGAAYPLHVDPIVQQAQLTASDGAGGDFFGDAVAVSGSTLVVGARSHATGDVTNEGAAYVFEKGSNGWSNATQVAELTPSDGAANEFFGTSVAIQGSTIVVGSETHAVNAVPTGAVYVFTEPVGGWENATQTAELTSSDGHAYDFVGASVAIDGSTIVAGVPERTIGNVAAAGAVDVWTEPQGGWVNATQTAELTASDATADDQLGLSVAVQGTTIVAGTPNSNVAGDPGAVYEWTEPQGGWQNATQTAKLTASDGATTDELGEAVAVSGSTIVAGARYHTANNEQYAGAVYVWTEPQGGWANATRTAELTSTYGAPGGQLGTAVAISGSTVVAGAPYQNVGTSASQNGAVWAWAEPSSGWANQISAAQFAAASGASNDYLGDSIGLDATTLVAGAPQPSGGGAGYADTFTATPLTEKRSPSILGQAAAGRRVLATRGAWSPATGLKYSYTWYLCTGAGEQGCTALPGSLFGLISPKLNSSEVGDYLTVVVGATSAAGGFGTGEATVPIT